MLCSCVTAGVSLWSARALLRVLHFALLVRHGGCLTLLCSCVTAGVSLCFARAFGYVFASIMRSRRRLLWPFDFAVTGTPNALGVFFLRCSRAFAQSCGGGCGGCFMSWRSRAFKAPIRFYLCYSLAGSASIANCFGHFCATDVHGGGGVSLLVVVQRQRWLRFAVHCSCVSIECR